MKKCVVQYKNGYVCITADRIEREEDVVFVYDGSNLVGMFDMGFVECVYLSEVREEK